MHCLGNYGGSGCNRISIGGSCNSHIFKCMLCGEYGCRDSGGGVGGDGCEGGGSGGQEKSHYNHY